MVSVNSNQIHVIDIPLTEGEKQLELALQEKPVVQLNVPLGFEAKIAWELANLTRIAYKDYEIFNEEDSANAVTRILKENFFLYTSSTISSERIYKYLIEVDPQDSTDSFVAETFKDGFYKYSIRSAYNYLAYTIGTPPKPDVENFGFIVQREGTDGSILTFVVFRGTREPEEWFNNFQFKQIPFLMQSENEISSEEVSLGFNKIYTDFRPGIFMDSDRANRFSRFIDNQLRQASERKYPEEHQLHTESIFKAIERFLDTHDLSDSKIYVTGHSLGGALATLSALHISQYLKQKGKNSDLALYTFASPRVGNEKFAERCFKMFSAYRIANSEDIVPNVPPSTFRIIGEEMLPGPIIKSIRQYLSTLTGGVTEDINEHVGSPVCFTSQLGEVSSNHNMTVTYCNALRRIPRK